MEDQAQALREIMGRRNPADERREAEEKRNADSRRDQADIRDRAPEKGKKTRIIAVASGKGGVGKTNLSVNLAIAYAKMGKKVIVMDADLGLANVNVMLNMIPKYNLYHVIRKQKTMREIILDTEYGIQIVAGASGFSKIANLSDEERQSFISELYTLSQADIIIIDTAAGVSANVLGFVAAADDAIIVTTPERIINISGQFLNLKVEYLGCIYDDPIVPASVLKQRPFIVQDPRSKAGISVAHLVGRIEKSEFSSDPGIGRFIKKLFGKD
jgi:flagellar biosynthesis protein FlhG